MWVTASGNPETFALAGRTGACVLTNLLVMKPRSWSPTSRSTARRTAKPGHQGEGHVTLMLHTFVGRTLEEVRAKVRGPFLDYLRTSTDLINKARWELTAFAKADDRSKASGTSHEPRRPVARGHGRAAGPCLRALLRHRRPVRHAGELHGEGRPAARSGRGRDRLPHRLRRRHRLGAGQPAAAGRAAPAQPRRRGRRARRARTTPSRRRSAATASRICSARPRCSARWPWTRTPRVPSAR